MKEDKGKFGYRFLGFFLKPLFRFYYNPKIVGKENIPKTGNILICGNHKHVMDQCGVVVSTKRMTHWMAKKEYFDDKKVAWFFRTVGCISVDRSIHDDVAKGKALDILKQGGAVGLFPEGTRNKTKEFMLPLKFGAVSMAQKTDSYIVPFGVSGDYKFRSKNLIYVFGEPFKVGDDLEEANKKLAEEIGKLMLEGQKIIKEKNNKKKTK